jgi:hypothetical protein
MPKASTPPKLAISPQMKHAWRRYESGDVVVARREAKKVLEAPSAPGDPGQARDLLERTGVSKSALYYALLAATLILVLILLAVVRS